MGSNGSKVLLQSTVQRAASDWVWGGLGLATAALSTSFALYMVVRGPAEPYLHGTPDFGVFAHLKPRTHTAVAGIALPAGIARSDGPSETTSVSDPRTGVDFTSTGSVSVATPLDRTPVPPTGKAAVSPNSAPLPSFILRDVFDGKALVESRNALSLVAPGSVLDGAGEVMSIERRDGGWVVTTTRGVISTQAR